MKAASLTSAPADTVSDLFGDLLGDLFGDLLGDLFGDPGGDTGGSAGSSKHGLEAGDARRCCKGVAGCRKVLRARWALHRPLVPQGLAGRALRRICGLSMSAPTARAMPHGQSGHRRAAPGGLDLHSEPRRANAPT